MAALTPDENDLDQVLHAVKNRISREQ